MNREALINRLVARKMNSKGKGLCGHKCKLCACACMYGAGKAPRMTAAGKSARQADKK
jgi:hypothetical protein